MVEQASLPQVAESSGALKDITFGSVRTGDGVDGTSSGSTDDRPGRFF